MASTPGVKALQIELFAFQAITYSGYDQGLFAEVGVVSRRVQVARHFLGLNNRGAK
jgi:hypothetical protein